MSEGPHRRVFGMAANLFVLYVANFVLRVAFGMVLIALAQYVLPDPAAGIFGLLAVAIVAFPYPLAEMLTANYFGGLSDHLGRRPVIVLGVVIAALMSSLYVTTQNLWALTVIHGIHGIGAAATVAPSIAMIADYADPRDRGRQMGFYDFSTFAGYIVGAASAGVLIDYLPFGADRNLRVTFLLIAAALLVSGVLLMLLIRREQVHPTRTGKLYDVSELVRVLKVPDIAAMFPVWLLISTLLGIGLTFLPRVFLEGGTSTSTVGLMIGGAGFVLLAMQPVWGWVSDRFGRLPVMVYGVLSILGTVVFAALFPGDILGGNLLVLAPLAVLAFGSGAFIPAALAYMADSAPKDKYGSTMGLYSFALGFGFFIAEAVGLVALWVGGEELGLTAIGAFAVIVIAGAAVLMLRFAFVRRRQAAASLDPPGPEP